MTLNEAYKKYSRVKGATWSSSSASLVAGLLKPLLERAGSKQIDQIDVQIISEWIAERLRAGDNPNTVRKRIDFTGAMFGWCRLTGLMTNNPMIGLPRVAAAETRKVPFSFAEYQTLIDACARRRPTELFPAGLWVHAVTVAWHTGMRMSDCALLEWDQIDFISDVVMAQPLKMRRTRQEIVIPIEPELRTHLLSLEQSHQQVCPAFAWAYIHRKPKICMRFRDICESVGLDRSFHCLRHSFVSRLLNAGANPQIVRTLTGQSLLTLSTYAHISAQAKRNAMEQSRRGELSQEQAA